MDYDHVQVFLYGGFSSLEKFGGQKYISVGKSYVKGFINFILKSLYMFISHMTKAIYK